MGVDAPEDDLALIVSELDEMTLVVLEVHVLPAFTLLLDWLFQTVHKCFYAHLYSRNGK